MTTKGLTELKVWSFLLTMILFAGCGPSEEWMHGRTKKILATMKVAVMTYYAENGVYPPSENISMVKALTTGQSPERSSPYLEFEEGELDSSGRVIDAWGNPLVFLDQTISGDAAGFIYSIGPNETFENGWGDDITTRYR